MIDQVTPETIRLLGGRLCLDFVNSVDWSPSGEPLGAELDALRDPPWLTRWGRRVGLVAGAGARNPGAGELRKAHELRAAVHAILSAVADGERPDPEDLTTLARHHARAATEAVLARGDGGWQLSWASRDPRLVRFEAAVDAVALLADAAALARLRRCPGRNCGWLFLDTSGRRRWCSMQTCGSREKMRRLRERAKADRRDGRDAARPTAPRSDRAPV
ncbi:MAG TPA: CGNR zinc finger domain-containing protein [Solirubrobacteraceae bacterium]|nr:CGNR zinc finger domain-containing protein [Solirubrobacteraceae bacterium]